MGKNDFSDFVNLLYGDQDLREMSSQRTITEQDRENFWGKSKAAIEAVSAGRRKEAAEMIKQMINSAELETRMLLWSWNTLRSLGIFPDFKEAEEVLGVLVEVPVGDGTDYLAAYADGRARYLNYSGAAIIWEIQDEKINELIKAVLKCASTIVPESLKSDRAEREPSKDLKMTFMTRDGVYLRGASYELMQKNQTIKTFMDTVTQLMLALIQKAQEAK